MLDAIQTMIDNLRKESIDRFCDKDEFNKLRKNMEKVLDNTKMLEEKTSNFGVSLQ